MASNNIPKTKGGAVNDNLAEIIREWDGRSQNTSEERLLRQKFEGLQQTHYREQIIYNQKQQETQKEIKNIQGELKGLAGSIKNLDKEIDKAIEQIPVSPGVYHVNFLEKIRQAIVSLKKRVEEASTWLEVFNQKLAKKHGYRPLAQKLGTQYSQSGERYVATSVG